LPNAQLEAGQHWARCLALAGLPTGNGNSNRH
jgi:adenylate cyclase